MTSSRNPPITSGWIPLTKGQYFVPLVFFCWHSKQSAEQTIDWLIIRDTMAVIWDQGNDFIYTEQYQFQTKSSSEEADYCLDLLWVLNVSSKLAKILKKSWAISLKQSLLCCFATEIVDFCSQFKERHFKNIILDWCHCPACRTTLVATRFRVAVICPIIQVPHCIRVFFYFVWFVFINHIFQFYYELCTYCNILDIYLS